MTTADPTPALRQDAPLVDRIAEVWEDRPDLLGFLTTVDHKRIGMRYLYTSFAFFIAAVWPSPMP